jgi:hypothetical protein
MVAPMAPFPSLLPPPEPAATAPAKTNDLLQLSESLAELNPSLRQFGLSAVRKFATDAEEDSKLAFAKMSPDQIAQINRMSQDEIVKNGLLPSGAMPSFYVNVQKLAAENEVNQKYQQFVLENYWQDLSNPLSTKNIPEILTEAQTKFFEGWGNDSAFGRLSGKNEADKVNRQLSNNAFQSRFAKRQERSDEESGVAGTRILFESLSPELPPNVRSENIVGFLDGEYKRGNTKAADLFIKRSVEPYISRTAVENPALARQYLTFLESVTLPTGASLGEIGFSDFQRLYRNIDQQELQESRAGVQNIQDQKSAIKDFTSLFFNEYSQEFNPENWSNDTKREIYNKILETDYIQIPGKDGQMTYFSLQENRHLQGYAFDVVSDYFNKYRDESIKADPEVLQMLDANFQEGDVDSFMANLELAKESGLLGKYESRYIKKGNDLMAGTTAIRSPSVVTSKSNIRSNFRNYFTNNNSLDEDFKSKLETDIVAQINTTYNQKLRTKLADLRKLEENKGKPLDIMLDEVIPQLETDTIQELQARADKENQAFIQRKEKQQKQAESQKAASSSVTEGGLPSLPGAFGFSKGDDVAHGADVVPLNELQKRGERLAWIQSNFEKVGLMDVSALSPEDQKVYSGWLKIREEELKALDSALGKQRILLAKDLIFKAFPRSNGGMADVPYKPEQLAERTTRYWKVVEMDGLSPEEVIEGKTDEKIPLPLADPLSPIKILTPHFRSTQELDLLVNEGKTSDNGKIEQMLAQLGIDPSNQSQVNQYLMEQRRMLYLRGR